MPRETSEITNRDLEWLELNKKIREVIKTKEEWGEFVDYMSIYFRT